VVWHVATRIVTGVGDLVQKIGDSRSMAGRLGGRVMPCAVCIMHVETRSASFLVEPQNQCRRFVSGLASKPLEQFLRFDLKTGDDSFLVESQNQGGGEFLGLGLKTMSYNLMI
jgi:hypothetical protein